jgi:hypothetical protein
VTAVLFSFVVGISLGMGLGVCGTLYLLWKRGVFEFQDVNDIRAGGAD